MIEDLERQPRDKKPSQFGLKLRTTARDTRPLMRLTKLQQILGAHRTNRYRDQYGQQTEAPTINVVSACTPCLFRARLSIKSPEKGRIHTELENNSLSCRLSGGEQTFEPLVDFF